MSPKPLYRLRGAAPVGWRPLRVASGGAPAVTENPELLRLVVLIVGWGASPKQTRMREHA